MHKPHNARETVNVFYRLHPLFRQRAKRLIRRLRTGEPVLMVADREGRGCLIPRWMTDPTAAEWSVRDVTWLSRATMPKLHGLVAMILRNPVPPETGDCNEISKTEDPSEDAAARAASSDQPAEDREGYGRHVSGEPDRGGDASTGPGTLGRGWP